MAFLRAARSNSRSAYDETKVARHLSDHRRRDQSYKFLNDRGETELEEFDHWESHVHVHKCVELMVAFHVKLAWARAEGNIYSRPMSRASCVGFISQLGLSGWCARKCSRTLVEVRLPVAAAPSPSVARSSKTGVNFPS